IARVLRRFATISRLIVFDKRGTGMSDPVVGLPTLEARMDDVRAVMDETQSRRAILYAVGEAGPLCALYAATYPERTAGLVLVHAMHRFVRGPDYPWGLTRVEREQQIDELLRLRLDPAGADPRWSEFNPDATEEERQSFARVFRLSVSPGTNVAYMRANLD